MKDSDLIHRTEIYEFMNIQNQFRIYHPEINSLDKEMIIRIFKVNFCQSSNYEQFSNTFYCLRNIIEDQLLEGIAVQDFIFYFLCERDAIAFIELQKLFPRGLRISLRNPKYKHGFSSSEVAINHKKQIISVQLDSRRLDHFPKSISELESLELLDLKKNKINKICIDLSKLKSLRYLNLKYNNISQISNSLINLRKLRELYLNENDLEQLPSEIGNLSLLKELNLYNNQLKSIPESIVKCKNLRHLVLSYNNLESIPESIGDIKALKYLILKDNKIRKVPKSIGTLKNLVSLDLDGNEIKDFTRIFIKDKGKLISLKDLSIWGNNFMEIPKSIVILEHNKFYEFKSGLKNKDGTEKIINGKVFLKDKIIDICEKSPPNELIYLDDIYKSLKIHRSDENIFLKIFHQLVANNKINAKIFKNRFGPLAIQLNPPSIQELLNRVPEVCKTCKHFNREEIVCFFPEEEYQELIRNGIEVECYEKGDI